MDDTMRLNELFTSYKELDESAFNQYCIEAIQTALKPNPQILRILKNSPSKNVALKKTSDFFMKGQGYGVI